MAGVIATYISTTSFTVVGDQTTIYNAGRRIRATLTSGYVYGAVSTSTYSSVTTVNLTSASDNLDDTLTKIYYGISADSIGSLPIHTHDNETEGGTLMLVSLSDSPSVYDDNKFLRSTASGTEWATTSGGIGTDHAELANLSYAAAGHIGFASTAALDIVDADKISKVISVDEEIVRFDGTDGSVQGYTSSAPTIDDDGKITADGGIIAPYIVHIKEENISNITKGQVLCIKGATGGLVKAGLADCDDSTKTRVLGLAFADITQNTSGTSQVHGILTGVNTQTSNTDLNPNIETWTAGEMLYLSKTAGGLTNVRPTSGRIVKIARTLTGNASNDSLYILGLKENPVWATAAADEDVVLRVGDSAGTNKVSVRDYNNSEVATIDSNGNLNVSGTIDCGNF